MKKLMYYFWIFYIASILGSIIETIWCLIKNKKTENRSSLIYEQMIPVYGLSGMLIVLVIELLNLNADYEIFFIGMIISTILEFIASYLQEKIFATKSWNYKEMPFNINGRVNIVYAIMFGLVGVFAYNLVLIPLTNILVNIKPNLFHKILSIILILFMLYDYAISAIAVYRMKERKNNTKIPNQFWQYIDKKYPDTRLRKVYPNMVDLKNETI